jgi:tetratricopeptide (TPR) repeat protein
MLDSAKSDYFAGQWSLALSGFEALVRAFPRSEAAGEAQFYIGETYYAQNKWREAIDAYGLVLQNYRNTSWRARRLSQARAGVRADGQTDKAREMWEAVIKLYPTATPPAWPAGPRAHQPHRAAPNRPLTRAAGVTCAVTRVRILTGVTGDRSCISGA